MPKLQQNKNGQWLVYIPGAFVKRKKWRKGQELILSFNERGHIEVMPVED